MTISREKLDSLVTDALAIEHESALEAGAVQFMARMLVQVTLPHSKQTEHVYERRNGAFNMTMMAKPSVGLPYGTIPRLLLTWLTSEAVRTKSLELDLGSSMSSFMRTLGMTPTGGAKGFVVFALDALFRRLRLSSARHHYKSAEPNQSAFECLRSKLSGLRS